MEREFELEAYRNDQELLLVCRGRLVLKYCSDLKSRIHSLLTPQIDRFYLYLADLAFLDSAGLGVLVGLKMASNKNRTSLYFLSPPPRIEDVFRVSKLDSIFEIRTGPEAEIICSKLKTEGACVLNESADASSAKSNTEYTTGTDARGGLTRMGSVDEAASEQSKKVHQFSTDALEYVRQADYERAIECYEQALEIDAENLSVLNNLGIVCEKKPQWYGRAVEIWKRVQQVSENSGDEKHATRARKHLESLGKLMGVD